MALCSRLVLPDCRSCELLCETISLYGLTALGNMMEELQNAASLGLLQRYVEQLENERGFAGQTVLHKCLLMGEEVGELFKAVRKHEGLPIEDTGQPLSIADELADLLIYLCAIANRYGIDLEEAFRAKERRNATRSWRAADLPKINP